MERTYRYIEDETVILDDGSDYTNAIFRRCRLSYTGGAVRIDEALFFDCEFAWADEGEGAGEVHAAIFRSLYASGVRTLHLNEDGSYAAQ